MKILTRYVIRSHVGPFLFAFTAVTGLLFVNAVAQRLENLAGKGLEWTVVAEFMVLSLPHIVALTFPMAVLVAVLYTFSEFASNNEMTAMAAGGVHPVRLLVPLLGMGVVLAGGMFLFNDRVLPESNHRLSSLLTDLAGKSPTFELREEVVNRIQTADNETYYLQASSIDFAENRLTDVVIYDASQLAGRRTIRAEEGSMFFSPNRTDLFLDLHNGTIHEVSRDRRGGFQTVHFDGQRISFQGVGDELERQANTRRGDREMTISMLSERIESNRTSIVGAVERSRRASEEAVYTALGLDPPEHGWTPATEGELETVVGRTHLEGPAERPTPAGGPVDPVREGVGEVQALDGMLPDDVTEHAASLHRLNASRVHFLQLSSYSYEVEIHKKKAIAFAIIIFILLGPPLASRFPRGGVGMVIAVSVGIFFLYWMGLIGGERLADRGHLNPVVAMWAPNVILAIPAAILLSQMARGVTTTRSSGWENVLSGLRRRLGRTVGGARDGLRRGEPLGSTGGP